MAATSDVRPSAVPASGFPVLALFLLTLFISAFLLFSIQPFFAKMVLPRLGGSPAVWSVAMVFFQGMLLLGYGYAHLLTAKFDTKIAAIIHGLVLLAAFVALPVAIPESWNRPPASGEALWLLGLFAASVGLPFFAVSANGPLLQSWFARTGHPHAADPYFLYGASNIGSLASLGLYIVLFEPLFTVPEQSAMWTGGFVLLAVMILVCALPAVLRAPRVHGVAELPAGQVSRAQILRWIALAFVPSGLLVAVTAHISVDVAAAPFLWVIPLILFLLTFVIAFQRRPIIGVKFLSRALPWAGAAALIAMVAPTSMPITAALAIHFGFLFLAALLCHSVLVSLRPPAGNLTSFYLWMSLGGVLGGIFASLVAPAAFNWIAEYPLLIVAALLCRPGVFGGNLRDFGLQAGLLFICGCFFLAAALIGWLPHLTQRGGASALLLGVIAIGAIVQLRSNRAYALSLVFLLPLAFLLERVQGDLFVERSFYGVVKVAKSADGAHRFMMHGTTIHGAMATDVDGKPPVPLTYYHESGGMARAVAALRKARGGRIGEVGVVGLGTGSILCHRGPGERWTSYEIDPSVVAVARNPALFRFVSECGEGDPVVIGDARLRLEDELAGKYDLLVVDAFSSDSVPAHLMTREAVELYRDKLAEGGLLVMHISNRHLELASVVAAIGADLGLEVRIGLFGTDAKTRAQPFVTPTQVAVLANEGTDLESLLADARWKRPEAGRTRPWTDDYSDIIGALWRAL